MAITLTTINGTDSVASSRITINDNYSTIGNALNSVLSIVDIATGKIDNLESLDILNVLIWSNFFKLKELKEFCENSLIFGINIDNVIEILITAFKYNFSDLKTYAVNFIMNNFHEVNSNKSFFLLEAYPQLMMEIMILSMNKIEKD